MLELEKMNEECRRNFEQFLREILEESNDFLKEKDECLQRDQATFVRIVDSYTYELELQQ